MTYAFNPAQGDRASSFYNAAVFAGDVEPQLARSYLVKGWLMRGGLSMVVGPSNVGKSFLAVDMAHHIAKGLEWHGTRTHGGPVLYVAAEGGANFLNRVAALEDPKFWVLSVPMTLTGAASDTAALADAANRFTDLHGPFAMIVLDTMARVMGTGDENAAPDIADPIRNLDGLRERTGAHVMMVHHSGKDLTRGARGHSSLRAAVDTEITLSRDEASGLISAALDKQRDGPTGAEFSYRLRQVELGHDEDGDPVTSCLVEPVEGARPAGVGAALPPAATAVLTVLDGLLTPDVQDVTLDFLRKACLAKGVSPADTPAAQRMAFKRGIEALTSAGIVIIANGAVRRINP